MTIRIILTEDYYQVYALWLSCKGMGLNDTDDSEEGFSRFIRRNPETCFVTEEDKEIIGTILAGNDGRRGYIYHTAVKSSERGKGIGSKLVEAVLDAFSRLDISKAALVVFETNESGNKFWERQGFTVRDDLVYRNRSLKKITRFDT